ncbi:MAG: AGE family epimerase/isomerase [Clostridia bacterium]|nr:AGE family epimerase/isomerase [Clostridia bacterium]
MEKKDYLQLFERELFESCIPFWLKNGFDTVNGGMYTSLDREGRIYSTDKSVWMQGRAGYMFSRMANAFGMQELLPVAKSCIDFLNAHCIDSDGRMYFTVTADGKPLRKRRYMFSETFYIIACAEYYKATGDKECLLNARKYYDFCLSMYRDPESDPYKITPKSVPGTRDMKALNLPMILLNVTCVLRDCDKEQKAYYDKVASELVCDIKKFNLSGTGFMLEGLGVNGEYFKESAGARVVNPGHSIELSWFLLDQAIYEGDDELKAFAQNVFDTAFDFGWDECYGGILYFKDLEGYPVEAYEHDMKLWWPHNEAIIASLKLYKETNNDKYFQVFERVVDYAFKHFSDFKYGEWYGYLRRDGLPTEPPCKGHTYKGPFHVLRMLTIVIELLKEMV